MYRDEGFAPGRQDLLKAINPVFRSASLIVAPLTFCAQDIRCVTLPRKRVVVDIIYRWLFATPHARRLFGTETLCRVP